MQPLITIDIPGYTIKITPDALVLPGQTIPWSDLVEILYDLAGNTNDTFTPTPLANHRATIRALLLASPGVVVGPQPTNNNHNDA